MLIASHSRLVAFAAAALALAAPHAARAQQSAVTLSGGLVERASDNTNPATGAPDTSFVLGYSFTLARPIAVTALGFYDDNNTADTGTAMTQTHHVGIFTELAGTGTLLVQATVAPTDAPYDAFTGQAADVGQAASDGTGDQLFRYDSALTDGATGLVPLSSFVLGPGTYVIAAVTGGDEYDELPGSDFAGGTFGSTAPVTYGQDRFATGDSTALQDPTQTTGNMPGGFPGGGYFGPNFRFTAAPEPSAWAGLALGALGLGGLALRARRRQAR